jgi:hypothetical protein
MEKFDSAKRQLAQTVPELLTGKNWPLPMYCNSTAAPWLPQMELVVAAKGWALKLQ